MQMSEPALNKYLYSGKLMSDRTGKYIFMEKK